jgi:hypothetical protein
MKFFIYSVSLFTRFWTVPETLELAAPHCAAGFRVRLNLHWEAPLSKFLFTGSVCLHGSGRFAKSELAAPHCAAGLRVRLYLHGRAPFVWISFVSINLHPKVMQAVCQK